MRSTWVTGELNLSYLCRSTRFTNNSYEITWNSDKMVIQKKNSVVRTWETFRTQGSKSFYRKASTHIAKGPNFFTFLYALAKIKNSNREHTLNEYLDFAFNDTRMIKTDQVRSEISAFMEVVDRTKPKAVLEIGTAGGGTLFLMCRIASEDATIISIDLPGGKFGGGYSKRRKFLYRQFTQPRQKIHLLMMDSHKREALEQVKAILGAKKIDLLFIDGDHTYEGVRSDFEMYGPLVRPGGLITFHDIVPGPSEDVGGGPAILDRK